MLHRINGIQHLDAPLLQEPEKVKCCVALCASIILALGVVIAGLTIGHVIPTPYFCVTAVCIIVDILLVCPLLASHRCRRNNPPSENPSPLAIQKGTPPVGSDFSKLPKVLYHEILKRLPGEDVKTFGEVCRYFHHRAQEELQRGWTSCQELPNVNLPNIERDHYQGKYIDFSENAFLIACDEEVQLWQLAEDRGENHFFLKQKALPPNGFIGGSLSLNHNCATLRNCSNSDLIEWDFNQNRFDNKWSQWGVNIDSHYLFVHKETIIEVGHEYVIRPHPPYSSRSVCKIYQASNRKRPDRFDFPNYTFTSSALVADRWLVGNGAYVDLEEREAKDIPLKAKQICAYKDRIIYLQPSDNKEEGAVYAAKMPGLDESELLLSGIDESSLMIAKGDILYVQTPDGIVLRYNFEKKSWLSKLRLGEWRMTGIVGNYLVAWNKKIRTFELSIV